MNSKQIIIGKMLNYLPYSFMPNIGKVYNGYRKDILDYEKSANKQEWIFKRVYNIVKFSIKNIPFYKMFYAKKGFELSLLNSYQDICKIPILTKSDLMDMPLEQRSITSSSCYLANTGGSTGMPLSFYKTHSHKIKEMAFYHSAWELAGYN